MHMLGMFKVINEIMKHAYNFNKHTAPAEHRRRPLYQYTFEPVESREILPFIHFSLCCISRRLQDTFCDRFNHIS